MWYYCTYCVYWCTAHPHIFQVADLWVVYLFLLFFHLLISILPLISSMPSSLPLSPSLLVTLGQTGTPFLSWALTQCTSSEREVFALIFSLHSCWGRFKWEVHCSSIQFVFNFSRTLSALHCVPNTCSAYQQQRHSETNLAEIPLSRTLYSHFHCFRVNNPVII